MKLPAQTLIELLIATAVISSGLFGASTLVFSNLQLADSDADQLMAINFARESLEQAKQARDSNWLAGRPFDEGLSLESDYTAVPAWDGSPMAPGISFDFSARNIDDPIAQIRQSKEAETLGFYSHSPNGNATPWRRLLTFHPICEVAGVLAYMDEGEACDPRFKFGVRVEVVVRWERKGRVLSKVMYEDLYDWR